MSRHFQQCSTPYGISGFGTCGGSCISKAKVCIKAMNPAQKQQYQKIVKAVKAGGEGADRALEDFKASLAGEGETVKD
ncbi:MAG: hypothetical protein HC771_23600 [Synechococcales cyanobacterium CRU_2_2]|nr:hypothetical protein [Synechococcales cyanobacterium CRU_2_2]